MYKIKDDHFQDCSHIVTGSFGINPGRSSRLKTTEAPAESQGKMRDLGFAFNDKDFSDRILHLEMVGDSLDSDSDSEGSDTELITENLKKKKKQKTDLSEEKGDVTYSCHSKRSTEVEVKTLHVCSAILAASSPFFYKLFKNGMRESQTKDLSLRINASEEVALMDLLKYMYTNTLRATSVPELVGVLIIADKFEVSSCVSYCCHLLNKMPMTLESALLYVDLSSSVSVGEVVQSLIDDAKGYLVDDYDHITKLTSQEESLAFPLSAVELMLRIVVVGSEEDVYEFILKWGRARYPKLKERREILTKLVGRVLYFPYLRLSTLKEIQDSPEFDSKEVSKLITESLYFNSGFPYGETSRFPAPVGHKPLRRFYFDLPIKVAEFGSSSHLVVYLNLARQDCEYLLRETGQHSQVFILGGLSFVLYVEIKCPTDNEAYLGLFVERRDGDRGDGSCVFDYEFAVMKDESSEEYESVHSVKDCGLSAGDRLGLENLFGVPWKEFWEAYFVCDVLHLRAQFSIKNSFKP